MHPRHLAPALAALTLAGAACASSVAARAAPPLLRQVRGIVARVVPIADRPASRVWILVLEDLHGEGGRWLSLRVPGRRDGDRVTVAAGVPLPTAGERMVLSLRRRSGRDWLLSRPDDWRTLRPGELP